MRVKRTSAVLSLHDKRAIAFLNEKLMNATTRFIRKINALNCTKELAYVIATLRINVRSRTFSVLSQAQIV